MAETAPVPLDPRRITHAQVHTKGRMLTHLGLSLPPGSWDLFVGRAIWLDGLARGFSALEMAPSLLLCNGIGPPGLLLHAAISLATGRGLPSMGCILSWTLTLVAPASSTESTHIPASLTDHPSSPCWKSQRHRPRASATLERRRMKTLPNSLTSSTYLKVSN